MEVKRELLEQAIDALDWCLPETTMPNLCRDAIEALRSALSAPERKPMTDEQEKPEQFFLCWQAATNAALERAAQEVSRVDNETWFKNQSVFGIACRSAILALKDE